MTVIGHERARSRSKHSRVLLSCLRMTLSAVRASSVPGPSALPMAGGGAAAPGPQFQVPGPRCDALITLRLGNHTPESRLSWGGTYARKPSPIACITVRCTNSVHPPFFPRLCKNIKKSLFYAIMRIFCIARKTR
ncbi:hypothetical protein CCHR01_17253 [Colletotrichum chrysophilum]|uniref:Uncharacterized protein n=1 Tax=Colletotrichum chrysophilum TaxID=1836956 RepID=A0AAD9A2F4_9PEZI|nr:hypothetical protein CCHR01_17253 [Colletotrichum chrysophilum]